MDIKGLSVFKRCGSNIDITVCFSKRSKLFPEDLEQFNKQYAFINAISNDSFHDRFLIIDGKECYSIGASLNYIGNKTFAVNKFEDKDLIKTIIFKVFKRTDDVIK